MQIFVDMDGVLADFDRGYKEIFNIEVDRVLDNVDWVAIRKRKNFFQDLPPMPDMLELWSYVSIYKPCVLTGVPSSVPEASDNKRAWIKRHLGDVPVITCPSKDKCLYGRPGDILIDDWEKYRQKWKDMGGIWITHTSAKSSIWHLQTRGL